MPSSLARTSKSAGASLINPTGEDRGADAGVGGDARVAFDGRALGAAARAHALNRHLSALELAGRSDAVAILCISTWHAGKQTRNASTLAAGFLLQYRSASEHGRAIVSCTC